MTRTPGTNDPGRVPHIPKANSEGPSRKVLEPSELIVMSAAQLPANSKNGMIWSRILSKKLTDEELVTEDLGPRDTVTNTDLATLRFLFKNPHCAPTLERLPPGTTLFAEKSAPAA